VVDASVVVAYLLGLATPVERTGLLGDPHAPALIDVEVTQALRGILRGGRLELPAASLAREELGLLGVRRYEDSRLLARAWELRDACTTYRALYVALAEALDVPLITRDAPLARGIGHLVAVQVTGD
jgi:predicted nucleic acid-binding protein